jgi:hypothetical protein
MWQSATTRLNLSHATHPFDHHLTSIMPSCDQHWDVTAAFSGNLPSFNAMQPIHSTTIWPALRHHVATIRTSVSGIQQQSPIIRLNLTLCDPSIPPPFGRHYAIM